MLQAVTAGRLWKSGSPLLDRSRIPRTVQSGHQGVFEPHLPARVVSPEGPAFLPPPCSGTAWEQRAGSAALA